MRAVFAIPGDLATPTGGYGYARRVLRGAAAAGIELRHVALGPGFPRPITADLKRVGDLLTGLPPECPMLIDGLAYGAMTPEVLQRIRAPVVALCHHPLALETGLTPDQAAALATSERAALAMAKAIVTTSRATADILTAQFGVARETIVVAPPGTDSAPRAPGSGGPGCAIVSVGSVTPRKGHVRSVEALAAISDCDWTLRIIGPTPDPGALAALTDAIDRLDLAERVHLVGPQSMMAVTAAYQAADLFVLASEYEGFGMAFAEAMAHGLPVLGLDCAAVAEATLGAARLVLAEEFPSALAALVRRPALRAELAENCWRAAARLPRWPDSISRIADVLRSVI